MASVSKTVLVPYAAASMFSLVERVEDYPLFLPWCAGAQVHERTPERMVATLRIDYLGLKQSFTTENLHVPDQRIGMTLREGPFSRLDGLWLFQPLREDACKVAGSLLSRALSPVFDQIATTFVDAFVKRADAVYG